MSERVREILSWYGSDNPGTLTNLARLLNAGTLAGTGRFVILPVDQGVEHGPARSFAVNPDAYDPRYHFELAIAAGCNAYAAQLGAHVIKVKLPSAHLEQAAAKKVYESTQVPIGTLAERVRHVVQAAFNGRRIVIFSGGAANKDEAVFDEVRAIRDGGGFGSIIGRNSFQRKKPEALKFLSTVMGIYAGTQK